MSRSFPQRASELLVSSPRERDMAPSHPQNKNMAAFQTRHMTVAKSRSCLLTFQFLLHLLFALLFSPLTSSLIFSVLTLGAFTSLLALVFFSLREGISFGQSITHSFILTAGVWQVRFGPFSVLYMRRLAGWEDSEGWIKNCCFNRPP